jgi:2-polyprenyl-6-methoxyphenol hydroxylase-like FAD-dependent oxidoreductase
MDPNLAGKTLGPGVQTGHVPMGPDRTYWFTTERSPQGLVSPAGELPYLQNKLAGWSEPIPAVLPATAPEDVIRNDLYDRSRARYWARGPVVVIGDAAHPIRPHLGQRGCQALEDAAILAAWVEHDADFPAAFGEFAAFRWQRVSRVVREAAWLGRVINAHPACLSAAASHASALIPEPLLTRHLASVASRSAFVLPRDA